MYVVMACEQYSILSTLLAARDILLERHQIQPKKLYADVLTYNYFSEIWSLLIGWCRYYIFLSIIYIQRQDSIEKQSLFLVYYSSLQEEFEFCCHFVM